MAVDGRRTKATTWSEDTWEGARHGAALPATLGLLNTSEASEARELRTSRLVPRAGVARAATRLYCPGIARLAAGCAGGHASSMGSRPSRGRLRDDGLAAPDCGRAFDVRPLRGAAAG